MTPRSRWIVMGCTLAALVLGSGPWLAAEEELPPCEAPAKLPGQGPLARIFRGAKDVVISPLEIPATMRRVAEEEDPFTGFWAGGLEGVGNGLMRLTAGAVEIVTFPIPGTFLPLYNRRLGERATPPLSPPTGPTRP